MELSSKFDWRKMIDIDLPRFPITNKMRSYAIERGVRGDVRLSLGKFPTDGEYNLYRERVLATPLP